MDTTSFGQMSHWADRVGVILLLVVIVATKFRDMWFTGSEYRAIVKERNDLRSELTRLITTNERITSSMEQLTTVQGQQATAIERALDALSSRRRQP